MSDSQKLNIDKINDEAHQRVMSDIRLFIKPLSHKDVKQAKKLLKLKHPLEDIELWKALPVLSGLADYMPNWLSNPLGSQPSEVRSRSSIVDERDTEVRLVDT